MSRAKDFKEARADFDLLRGHLHKGNDYDAATSQIMAVLVRLLKLFDTPQPACSVEGDPGVSNGLPELAGTKFTDVLFKIEPTMGGVFGSDNDHRQLIDQFIFERGTEVLRPSPLIWREERGIRTMRFVATQGFNLTMKDQYWARHIIGVLAGLIYADKPTWSKESLIRAVGGDLRAASEAYITVCTACLNDRWWRATYGEPVVPYSYLAAARASMDPGVFAAASDLVQKCIVRQQGVLRNVVG